MKISRKMKKFFVSFLAATLSIIMFATQTSALNEQTVSAEFEHVGVVDALETMTWDPDRNWFLFSVDLTCYEHSDVDYVEASLELKVEYPSSSVPEYYDQADVFTYLNTDDSDELLISITNFDQGYDSIDITATITYEIFYDDSTSILYEYEYDAIVFYGKLSAHRALIRTVPAE